MQTKGTIPKYEEYKTSCGKCGENLFPTEYDRFHKPKYCRNCGEKIDWSYLKSPNPNADKIIAENEHAWEAYKKLHHLNVNKLHERAPNLQYVLKINFNTIELVEAKKIDLPFLREQIGCQWVEAIPCPYGYVVGDEEYCLHHPPARNLIASRLVRMKLNGICLLVDVKESDFVPFSREEAEEIREKLLVSNDTKLNK